MSAFPNLDLGPIQSLLGKWRGAGKDVAFLPGGVRLESDYIEEMSVSVAPIMRVTRTLFVNAAAYETRLVDAKSGEPLHHESGYWAWVPESKTALRIIALGRALGVVASFKLPDWPVATVPPLRFEANVRTVPPSIATASIGANVPVMEEFVSLVEISGNSFTYDQVTRVRFGAGDLLDHTDKATLVRQP